MAKPISTTIRVNDRASAPLNYISKCLGKCINNFTRLDAVSSSAINVGNFSVCDDILNSINDNVEKISKSMEETATNTVGFDNNLDGANNSANALLSTIKKVAATYLTLQAAGQVIDTSDNLTLAKQRLELTLREGETVDDLNKKIMSSANSARASYTDMFNQVSKLGMNAAKSFDNTDQIIKFVESFDKLAILSGASVYESSQAMYQLTQSMAKGKLDGDELRSVMEGMPLVAKTIADYLGTDVGTMKEMAAEGLVTSEVVRNALLGAASDTDEKVENLGFTWAQTMTMFKNNAIAAFEPVLMKINSFANNEKVQSFISGLVNGMHVAASAVMWLFDAVSVLFGFIYDNWSILQPIMGAGLVILGLYTAAMVAHNVVQGISNVMKAISAVVAYADAKAVLANAGAYSAKTVATAQATVAQSTFNTALLACPATWILLLIVAIVAAIYMVIGAINKVTGATISATGVIFAVIFSLGAAIWNIVVGVLNGIIQLAWAIFVEPFIGIIEWVLNAANGGFTSFGGAVQNLLGQIISWFLSLGKVVTRIIDAIFGTNWTDGLTSLQDQVTSWGKTESAISIDHVSPEIGVGRIDYADSWNAGYDFGEGIEDKVSNMFNVPGTEDFSYDFDDMGASLGAIEDNTGKTAKSVDISQEDLKYLRDIAEHEAINKFTTAKITVDMTNNNSINSDMDLDGIVDHLATRVTEAMEVVAAGAY